jgi:hypothetical protein
MSAIEGRDSTVVELRTDRGAVRFRLHDWADPLPEVAGVFFLGRWRPGEPGPRVYYVGETGDLRARRAQSIEFPCFQNGLLNVVGLCPTGSESHRVALADDLARRLSPPCNRCWPAKPRRLPDCPLQELEHEGPLAGGD